MFRTVLISMLLAATALNAKHQKMKLQKAIDLKLVKARATSLGGHQGYCIRMELKNLSPDSIIVTVEAGRRLNSMADKDQDILITKEEIIALKKLEEKCFDVRGYCCQSSNCSPSRKALYDLNKMADHELAEVAKFLNRNSFSAAVEQQAVWAISDKKPTAFITSGNDSLLLPLRQFVADLKGEKLPWYTLISGSYVYPNGIISTFALWLKGTMEYANDKEAFVTLHVFNEKGMPVCLVRSEWLKAGSGEKYNLNLPVKGLAKGKYKIELKSDEKSLAVKEFEI